jgi:hypothetical protein
VNLDSICIILSKFKKSSKLLIGNHIPPSLCHPIKYSCVPPILNIQSGIELSYYLIIPTLLEGHNIPQVLVSTCSHYFIKDPIMFSLHIGLIYPLGHCYRPGLGDDNGLIKVLLKGRVKSVVHAQFLLNKSEGFLFSFPSLSLSCPCSLFCPSNLDSGVSERLEFSCGCRRWG